MGKDKRRTYKLEELKEEKKPNASDSIKLKGIIVKDTGKSFGYIKYEVNKEVFFHFNDVDNKSLIVEGREVEFEMGKGKNDRDAAINVKILNTTLTTQSHREINLKEGEMPEYYLPSDTKLLIKQGEVENFALKFHKYAKFNKDKFKFYSTEKNNIFNDVNNVDFSNIDFIKINKQIGITAEFLFGEKNVSKFELDTDWRLAIGLGTESVYETSMTLHPIYGIPYIPGQAIKGITRSWIVNEFYKKIEEDALADSEPFCKIFGCSKMADRNRKSARGKDYQGSVIFFDAFPLSLTSKNLKVDVMNPHYGQYYNATDNTPPADYYNPIPIYFLTVENTKYQFVMGIKEKNNEFVKDFDSSSNADTILNITKKYLNEALLNQGIGAKSAVGYGYFEIIK